jgi:hypothetical protein
MWAVPNVVLFYQWVSRPFTAVVVPSKGELCIDLWRGYGGRACIVRAPDRILETTHALTFGESFSLSVAMTTSQAVKLEFGCVARVSRAIHN